MIQLTGTYLKPNQTEFPYRTPADPIIFRDPSSNEILIYGTQVLGNGITYLKYDNEDALLTGKPYTVIERSVLLPDGNPLIGKEALWDTVRLSYIHLKTVFEDIDLIYQANSIKRGSDIYFAGIALTSNDGLGEFPKENWRRRIHPIVERPDGSLQVIKEPMFNTIPSGAKTEDYVGFGEMTWLPGDYLGHAYGPNFKIVDSPHGTKDLWLIHEEVARRIEIDNRQVEVTEIFARKMTSPLKAGDEKIELISIHDANGEMATDTCRGAEMNYTKLLEGLRPTHIEPGGIKLTHQEHLKADGTREYINIEPKHAREFYFLTGSAGNFCSDGYDVIKAFREHSPIGPYKVISDVDSTRWKRFIDPLKKAHGLSWAGRGSFFKGSNNEWWLIFHAVNKAIIPNGSYSGKIPSNTQDYHRNLYLVPVSFFVRESGDPDVLIGQHLKR